VTREDKLKKLNEMEGPGDLNEKEKTKDIADGVMIKISVKRMGGHAPVVLAIPESSTFQDLKNALTDAVPVGVFGYKLVTEEFEVLYCSLGTRISELNLSDGASLTMITETCRDYSRIAGPEKVLKTGKHPCGIYIDDEGNFFINHYYGEFKKYNDKFELVCESKIQPNPWQMARAPSGEFLMAYSDGIHIFEPTTLKETRVIPGPSFKGVAVEGELVYASSSLRNEIRVFQLSDGKLMGTHTPDLKQPSCLTVIDGRLLAVADRGNDRILLLDLHTLEVRSQLPPARAPSHQRLSKPNDMVVDSAGNLLVMDVGGQRIAVFREDGTFIASVLEGFFVDHGNTYPYLSYNQITGSIAASNDDEHCVTIFSPIFKVDEVEGMEQV